MWEREREREVKFTCLPCMWVLPVFIMTFYCDIYFNGFSFTGESAKDSSQGERRRETAEKREKERERES